MPWLVWNGRTKINLNSLLDCFFCWLSMLFSASLVFLGSPQYILSLSLCAPCYGVYGCIWRPCDWSHVVGLKWGLVAAHTPWIWCRQHRNQQDCSITQKSSLNPHLPQKRVTIMIALSCFKLFQIQPLCNPPVTNGRRWCCLIIPVVIPCSYL